MLYAIGVYLRLFLRLLHKPYELPLEHCIES